MCKNLRSYGEQKPFFHTSAIIGGHHFLVGWLVSKQPGPARVENTAVGQKCSVAWQLWLSQEETAARRVKRQ